jgi:hypothetical protein
MITLDEVRPLTFAIDKVDASGSEVSLDAATLAALETITVVATNLDIRDLAFATDKVDVSGSEVSLDAATLAALESITVNEAGYSSWKSTAHAASDVVSQIASTPLTARVNITIENLGPNDVFIGQNNAVTIATGTKIAKFASFSEKLAAGANIWAICAAGQTADLRIAEFAV